MLCQELVAFHTLHENSCHFKDVNIVAAVAYWSAKTSVPQRSKNAIKYSPRAHKRSLDSLFFQQTLTIVSRLPATVALSRLSLNTYQDQLDLRKFSKQAIFLIANVADAWQKRRTSWDYTNRIPLHYFHLNATSWRFQSSETRNAKADFTLSRGQPEHLRDPWGDFEIGPPPRK